jgi:hypothetical protein
MLAAKASDVVWKIDVEKHDVLVCLNASTGNTGAPSCGNDVVSRAAAARAIC